MSSIEKEIDNLGRIVLPKKFRDKLGLTTNSKVNLSLNESTITITSTEHRCILCNNPISEHYDNMRLCKECILKIKKVKL